MNHAPPLVIVVDDDPSVRRALARLLESEGLHVETFASASAYLERPAPRGTVCLVLDVRMPGLNGLDLQRALSERNRDEAIVFVTGHGDVPMCATAKNAGAVDFLMKPFSNESLLAAVAAALDRARARAHSRAARRDASARLSVLSPRESEVFRLIVAGLINKHIAAELGTAEKTVKNQRAQIVAKLGVSSVAEMVRLAQQAGLSQPADDGSSHGS